MSNEEKKKIGRMEVGEIEDETESDGLQVEDRKEERGEGRCRAIHRQKKEGEGAEKVR